jgi:hypothetical protein
MREIEKRERKVIQHFFLAFVVTPPLGEQRSAAAQLFGEESGLDQRRLPWMRAEGRGMSANDAVGARVKLATGCKIKKGAAISKRHRESCLASIISFWNLALGLRFDFDLLVEETLDSCFVHSSGA